MHWYFKHWHPMIDQLISKYQDHFAIYVPTDIDTFIWPTNHQWFIAKYENNFKEKFITEQDYIVGLRDVLYVRWTSDFKAVYSILKSINVKFFLLMQSVQKILQPFEKITYKWWEEWDFHLTKLFWFHILRNWDHDYTPYFYIWDDKQNQLPQIICNNLNTFYRESFSILELFDILFDVANWTIVYDNIKDLSNWSPLRWYGYRWSAFTKIEWLYQPITDMMNSISKFIWWDIYSYKDIRNVIAHRLDYWSVYDIENEWYTNQYVDLMNKLLPIKSQIVNLNPKDYILREYKGWSWTDLIQHLLFWKNDHSQIDYPKLIALFPDFESDLEELIKIQYVVGIKDDIMNIFIYLSKFKELINLIYSSWGM